MKKRRYFRACDPSMMRFCLRCFLVQSCLSGMLLHSRSFPGWRLLMQFLRSFWAAVCLAVASMQKFQRSNTASSLASDTSSPKKSDPMAAAMETSLQNMKAGVICDFAFGESYFIARSGGPRFADIPNSLRRLGRRMSCRRRTKTRKARSARDLPLALNVGPVRRRQTSASMKINWPCKSASNRSK